MADDRRTEGAGAAGLGGAGCRRWRCRRGPAPSRGDRGAPAAGVPAGATKAGSRKSRTSGAAGSFCMVQPSPAEGISGVVLLRVAYSLLRMTSMASITRPKRDVPGLRDANLYRLEHLAGELCRHGLDASIVAPPGRVPRLEVSPPSRYGRRRLCGAVPGRHLVVLVAMGRADRQRGRPRRRRGTDRAGARQARRGLAPRLAAGTASGAAGRGGREASGAAGPGRRSGHRRVQAGEGQGAAAPLRRA